MLALAARFNCSALVLGAWGCGVFKNSPRLVAGVFKDLLTPGGTFHGRFDKVLFSVYDSSQDLQTFREFKQAFT
jgi:uncharacterized protein (TIGR02452 family)